jgi:hypothetical protein
LKSLPLTYIKIQTLFEPILKKLRWVLVLSAAVPTHPPKSPKKDSIDAPEGDSPILGLQPALFQNNNISHLKIISSSWKTEKKVPSCSQVRSA